MRSKTEDRIKKLEAELKDANEKLASQRQFSFWMSGRQTYAETQRDQLIDSFEVVVQQLVEWVAYLRDFYERKSDAEAVR